MWHNRITQFVPSDRGRFEWPVTSDAATCCASSSLTYPAGAFMVPPSAGVQPGIYALAREQAVFVLRQRSRARRLHLN